SRRSRVGAYVAVRLVEHGRPRIGQRVEAVQVGSGLGGELLQGALREVVRLVMRRVRVVAQKEVALVVRRDRVPGAVVGVIGQHGGEAGRGYEQAARSA